VWWLDVFVVGSVLLFGDEGVVSVLRV